MNDQVSLNAIALSVALLTFSVLIGPYLHLPPEIPAAVTLGALVLFAIDSFGFQGLGSRLLLDGLTQLSSAHRRRVVHHEAGHFLTAHLLDVPVTGYTLSAWGAFREGHPGQGGVRVDVPDSDSITASELDHYCTIWMAGGVAESLVYDSVEGGADDLKTLRGVLKQLEVQDAVLKERLAGRRAQKLLQDNWTTYEALVAAMEQRQSVADCRKLIDQQKTASPVT